MKLKKSTYDAQKYFVFFMIPIKNLLNKIKWDKKEDPKDYEIFYYDRVLKKLICLNFSMVKKTENNLLTVIKDDEEISIPFHRIRRVKKKGKVVWER